MKDSSTYHAQSVGEWVVLATDGLVAPARDRISLEIEAHYADAVKTGMAEGLTREDAKAAALLGLGEAKAAAKGFRKRHLTQDEEKWLRKWVEISRVFVSSKWFWYFFCLPFFYMWLMWGLDHKVPYRLDLATVTGLGLCCVHSIMQLRIRHLVTNSSFAGGFERKLLLLEMMSFAIWSLLYLVTIPLMPFFLFGLCVFFVVFGIFAPKRLSLWNKLRHAQSSNGKGLEA